VPELEQVTVRGRRKRATAAAPRSAPADVVDRLSGRRLVRRVRLIDRVAQQSGLDHLAVARDRRRVGNGSACAGLVNEDLRRGLSGRADAMLVHAAHHRAQRFLHG